jgi:Fe-S cluster assembly iron-binding protein IscA
MLQITEDAATFLRETKDVQGLPDEAMLRIASRAAGDDSGQGLQVGFVPEAMPGDEIADRDGTAVCVAPDVAPALDGKLLDVTGEARDRQLVLRD